MKKLDIKSYIIGFLCCFILTSVIVGASLLFKANEIEFVPKDTTWNVDNVSDALSDIKDNYTPNSKIKGISWDFDHKNSTYKFSIPISGKYKIELWGAEGGYIVDTKKGGLGSYTSGEINLNKGQILYVVIAPEFDYERRFFESVSATDIRLNIDNIKSFDSLKTRIMVAANGGSGGYMEIGPIGGGLSGFRATNERAGYGATQTSGGSGGTGATNNGNVGTFGYGGNGSNTSYGGSGYYGGGSGGYSSGIDHGATGSGSSFISGHDGCNALDEDGAHTGSPNHYSQLVFEKTQMIDGGGCLWTTSRTTNCPGMPDPRNYTTVTGNSGAGYARITLIAVD